MTVEQYIKNNICKIVDINGRVFTTPNIPNNKLANALNSMALGISPESVVALVDATVFGGAKEGCLFTNDCLYAKRILVKPYKIPYEEMNTATSTKAGNEEKVIVQLKSGEEVDIRYCLIGSKLNVSAVFLNELIHFINNKDEINEIEEAKKAALKEAEAEINAAKLAAIEEVKRQAVEEAKAKAVEEAKRQAVEEARLQAIEEAKRQAVEEAKAKAVEEAKRQAIEEAKAKAVEEAKRQAIEEAKAKTVEEAKRQAVEEAKRQAAEETPEINQNTGNVDDISEKLKDLHALKEAGLFSDEEYKVKKAELLAKI